MWDEWCGLSSAEALPGALDFTNLAAELGLDVYYISNRGIHLLEVTLENLKSAGFPFADTKHVLLKTDTSVKEKRRAKVRETHNVVLLIGDNLGDFSGIFDKSLDGADSENVMAHMQQFGYEYIMLPNPLYGGWEKPFRGESSEATSLNKRDALNFYRP
jgi:5'-nucleotidase (lipoprotein e(P4) family)